MNSCQVTWWLGNGTVIDKALNEFKKLIHLIDCACNLSTIQINFYSTFDANTSQGIFQQSTALKCARVLSEKINRFKYIELKFRFK